MEKPEFREAYFIALEFQRDSWADEIVDAGSGVEPEHVNREKLRSDNRKWLLARLHPHKFGDRQSLEMSTPPGRPLAVEVGQPLCPAEVAKRIAQMLVENEIECGLPVARDLPDGERLRRIIETGEPTTPALYSALSAGSSSGLSYDSRGRLNRHG